MDSDGVQVHIKRKNITCRKCVNMCEHTLYHSPHALCVMRFNFQPTVKPTSTRLKTPRMILLIVKSWQPPRKTRMIVEMNQFLHWPHATYQRIAPQYRNCPDVACQPFAGTSRVGVLVCSVLDIVEFDADDLSIIYGLKENTDLQKHAHLKSNNELS